MSHRRRCFMRSLSFSEVPSSSQHRRQSQNGERRQEKGSRFGRRPGPGEILEPLVRQGLSHRIVASSHRHIARDHVTSHRSWRQEPASHAQCGGRELAWTLNSVWPSRGRSPGPVDCASLRAAHKKTRDPLNFKNHMRRGGLYPQGFGSS